MNNASARRAAFLAAILVVALGFGVALIKVFNENLVFFYTPSQILGGEVPSGEKTYRLGGMVEVGSVQREPDSLRVRFVVSDMKSRVPVEFNGIVPDLFKEGTGVVADGQWNGSTFMATEVLAKHDENYMPPGVEK
ncbi:MAG TPA: cytochrome c maturation protein CcmE [Limnobacter sp.]|nr:cytochrome c maturation protein CcmE [Limnobacter sp.]